MSHPAAQLLYWSPRILAIAFAVFLSIFALDVFNETHGFWTMLLAVLVHLIPAALIVAALIAAWRWEWIGAGLFALLAAFYAWQVVPRHISWLVTIDVPLLLIAALFLANWIERAKLRAALRSTA
jgi:hypothetical protein